MEEIVVDFAEDYTDDWFEEEFISREELKAEVAVARAKAKAEHAGKTREEEEEEEDREEAEFAEDDTRNAEMISRLYPDDPKLTERKHLFSDVFYVLKYHQSGDTPGLISVVIDIPYSMVRTWIRKYGHIPYKELTPSDIQDELARL
jgi:hypothetical protein